MKRLKLIVMFVMVSAVALMAQDEGAFKEISHKEVPGTVLAAIENDFSGATVLAYYVLPVDLYENHWSAKQTKKVKEEGGDLHHYLVKFDGDVKHNKVVYNAQGILLQKREVIKGADLPEGIASYIAAKYEGYTIIKDKELVKVSEEGTVDTYKIEIEKGKEKKSLFFSGEGELIKEK